MKLISSLMLILLSSCSSIFWREAKLFPSISFSETEKKLAYLRVFYKEKDSWNPLDGTTHKKEYTTQLILAEIQNNLSVKKVLEVERFNFWILPESLFYNEGTGTIAFINGLNQDEYGTPNRTVSVYNVSSKKIVDLIKDKPQIKTPLSIALSVDATLLAVVSGEINANGFLEKFQLHILNLNDRTIQSNFPLPDWQESPTEFELAWSKTEPVLYARGKSKLFTIKGKSISESKFSGTNLADNSKYAYFRAFKWESADVEVEQVKLDVLR